MKLRNENLSIGGEILATLLAPLRLIRALVMVYWKQAGIAILAGLLVFSSYSAFSANRRLAVIEGALGGSDNLKCTRQATIDKIRPSIVRVVGGAGDGSGFLLQEGIVLTDYHVIADEPSPKIVYSDNQFETGSVLAVDSNADLALIRINREGLPSLSWYLDPVQTGQEVLAAGFPLGTDLDGELTVNSTTVSGKRTLDVDGNPSFIQFNGGFVEGMSGGPVVSQCGQVVGVVESSIDGHGESVALATSASLAIKSVNPMMEFPSASEDEIAKFNFQPDKSPQDTIEAYYNYLKARNFKEAYALLSGHFIGNVSYEEWQNGFSFSLDTTILDIKPIGADRVYVKLGSTDLVDGQFVVRTFEGTWSVKREDGHYKLWESNIKELEY